MGCPADAAEKNVPGSYTPEQMAQELKVTNAQRGQGAARADIVIWKSERDKSENRNAFIVVECKAENVRIHEEDYYQGLNYASWAGASFFVTTNEKETKYFNVDKDYLPKNLTEAAFDGFLCRIRQDRPKFPHTFRPKRAE